MARIFTTSVDDCAELVRIRRPSDWDWARYCGWDGCAATRERVRLVRSRCCHHDWLARSLFT
jgi:hypothetical protein